VASFDSTLPFFAYRIVASLGLRKFAATKGDSPHTLLLLRVFGFDKRTQALLDQLGSRWRHVGPITLIAGTDLAYASLDPHDFLEFLGRRLSRQFIMDAADLEARLKVAGKVPDPDGSYRIEDYFCHEVIHDLTLARRE